MPIFQILSSDIAIGGLTLAISLLAIIFAFGVVWRTEKELDISYKFFLGAIIVFAASEFLDLFYLENKEAMSLFILVLRLVFSILFLVGILTARDLLRKVDGEKGPVDEETI